MGGYLWHLNLETKEKEQLHRFPPSEVATDIAIDHQSGDIFLTSRGLYRIRGGQIRQVVAKGIDAAIAVAFSSGELFVYADGGRFVIELTPDGENVRPATPPFPQVSDLTASKEGNIWAAFADGVLYRLPGTRPGGPSPGVVWNGGRSKYGVFVTTVGDLAK